MEPETIIDGRYKLGEELGAGGMGTVHRAERVKIGRAVAIKFLRPALARQPDFVKRFEREAIAMSRIYHHHCVSILDYGMHDDSPYLVMEYVPGRSLARILRDGPLPAARAIHIVQQLLDTLRYFHARNVLHRDLKAENIMIAGDEDEDDFVKLLDLGMAKLLSGVGADISISVKGTVAGTPSAMSPEQIRELPLDGRSDLYSTGVLLYHMLVGQKPFFGDDMIAVFKMHLEQPPVPPSEILGTRAISPELEAVVLKALAKDREQRFPDAAAMSEALAATREAKAQGQGRRASTLGVGRATPAAGARGHGMRPLWIAYGGWALAAVLGVLLAVKTFAGGGARVARAPTGAVTTDAPAVAHEPAGAANANGGAEPPRPESSAAGDGGAGPPGSALAPATSAPVETAAPWAVELDDARAKLGRGEHRAALKALAALVRAQPAARADGEVMRAAVGALAAPDGDTLINALTRDFGTDAPLIDALAEAMTGAASWYARHHAWIALQRAGHAARADVVALWIADLERADGCKATRRAIASLRETTDPRAVAVRAALADPDDARYATQRACADGER